MPGSRLELIGEYAPPVVGGQRHGPTSVSIPWPADLGRPAVAERRHTGSVALQVTECADAPGIATLRLSCAIPHGARSLMVELCGAMDLRSGDVTLVGRLPGPLVDGRVARVAEALPATGDCPPPGFGLTCREADVARLLARGERNARIAALLDISPHTARRHTEAVMLKLGVHSRAAVGPALRGERP